MTNNSGVAFHCYRGKLFGFVYGYDGRVQDIKKFKPANEQPLWLARFKLIPDELLPGRTSLEYRAILKTGADSKEAWNVYDKAVANYEKAKANYEKATLDKAWTVLNKAWADYKKTSSLIDKAWAKYDQSFGAEVLRLHDKLCLACPWDGRTIFTRKDKNGNWY